MNNEKNTEIILNGIHRNVHISFVHYFTSAIDWIQYNLHL